MNPTSIPTWFEKYSKMPWKILFSYFLSDEILNEIQFYETGLASFIKGYNSEFKHENYEEALVHYQNGAQKLDCLCLFRLHEIYLGDENFKQEYDEGQAISYMAWSGLLTIFDEFSYPVIPAKKFHTFVRIDKDRTREYIEKTENDILNKSKKLMLAFYDTWLDMKLFPAFVDEFINTNSQDFMDFWFPFINCIWYIVPSNSTYFTVVERLDNSLVSKMMDHNIFSEYFKDVTTIFKLSKIDESFAGHFRTRITNNLFWSFVFSFLSIEKNSYLSSLLVNTEHLLDSEIITQEDIRGWVIDFHGFLFEKGIGCDRDFKKSLKMLDKDIQSCDRIIYPRIRRAIILKKMGKTESLEDYIADIERRISDREKRNGCSTILSYMKGKVEEKLKDNIHEAINFYVQGYKLVNKNLLTVLVLSDKTWKQRCKKRLMNLRAKHRLVIKDLDLKEERYED